MAYKKLGFQPLGKILLPSSTPHNLEAGLINENVFFSFSETFLSFLLAFSWCPAELSAPISTTTRDPPQGTTFPKEAKQFPTIAQPRGCVEQGSRQRAPLAAGVLEDTPSCRKVQEEDKGREMLTALKDTLSCHKVQEEGKGREMLTARGGYVFSRRSQQAG